MLRLNTPIFNATGEIEPVDINEARIMKNEFRYEILSKAAQSLGYVDIYVGDPCLHWMKKYITIKYMRNTAPKGYKNIGSALHELTFQLSFLKCGRQGHIKLVSYGDTALFHYGCGFRFNPKEKFYLSESEELFNHPIYGAAAYAKSQGYELNEEDLPSFLKNSLANDLYAFYFHIYKTLNHEEREEMRDHMSQLMLPLFYLPNKTIAEKKEQFLQPILQTCSAEELGRFSLYHPYVETEKIVAQSKDVLFPVVVDNTSTVAPDTEMLTRDRFGRLC